MDLSNISKAIAGGISSALVALLVRYFPSFQPGPETISAIGVIVTAIVGYAIGHLAVYFAPANKPKV